MICGAGVHRTRLAKALSARHDVVPVDGGTTDTSGVLEANLDIDMVRAIAPAARVLVYEASGTPAA